MFYLTDIRRKRVFIVGLDRLLLLYLFFVSDLSKSLLYDQVSYPVFSRHDLIFLTFDFKLETGPPKIVYYRDFKNINYLKLESAINNIIWNNIYELNTVDEHVQYLQNNISDLFPLKRKQFIYPKMY